MTGAAIRGLLLDLDDTLLDHRGAADQAATQWAADVLGWTDAASAVSTWRRLETEWFPLFERGRYSFAEQRRHRVRGFAPAFAGLGDDDLDALFGRYLSFYWQNWRPRPGAAELIARALDASWRVGVLTNGDQGQQAEKLDSIGLAAPDVHVFASSTLGFAKPDEQAYRLACSGLGTEPDRTVMVGDNYAVDVLAAREAGLGAIHLCASPTHRRDESFDSLVQVATALFGEPFEGERTVGTAPRHR